MIQWDEHRVDGIYNGRCLSFVVDYADSYTISSENPSFDAAVDAFKTKNFEKLIAAVQPLQTVLTVAGALGGTVEVMDDSVYFNGKEMHGVLIDRIIEFSQEGFDYAPLTKFLQKLLKNPSTDAIDELYMFLESSTTPMPITSDGNFLAYKKVRSDYMDIYSGSVSYKVGEEPFMERNAVDANRDRTCSRGLHFCSIGYLPIFGMTNPEDAKIIIVEIDPADVVSIPSDYSNAKGRACKMKVVGELSSAQFNQAIDGVSAWKNNFVDTTPVVELEDTNLRPVDGNKPPLLFVTRQHARDWTYVNSGKVVDTRSKNNHWSVVSGEFIREDEIEKFPAFFSRSQARDYRDNYGGIVVDSWKSQYSQYAQYKFQHDGALRWVVIDE